MPAPMSIDGPAGRPVWVADGTGRTVQTGTATVGGLILPEGAEPSPRVGEVALYNGDGDGLALVGAGGAGANLQVTGDLAVTGSATVGSFDITGDLAVGSLAASDAVIVGASTGLGDNGVGVLEVAYATTVPSTNPANGVVVSSHYGLTPLEMRDEFGGTRSLADGYIPATADQTINATTQTPSTYLTASVESNATYIVEAYVYWTTASSATVTTSWTAPSGATMLWNDTTTGGDVVTAPTGVSPAWPTGNKMVRIYGILGTSGGGTLTFTIAPSVSGGVTIKAGSVLTIRRVH